MSAGGLWLAPVLSALASIWWSYVRRPNRRSVNTALMALLFGSAVVAGGMILVALNGPRPVPWFVPPEESACPGLLLGYTAGMLEEATFRVLLLPLSYAALRRHIRGAGAAVSAVVVTSLLFAVLHDAVPGVSQYSFAFFATRFLFPGCFMSALFFRPGPAFPVALHCALHLVIPFFYTSPTSVWLRSG